MSEQAPAGWYRDGDGNERYWDGSTWTDQRGRTDGEVLETFRGLYTGVAEGRSFDRVTDNLAFDDQVLGEDKGLFRGYEITAHAMHAAADFVQAAWEIRKDITYVPPQGLADWLRRTPEELRGDEELPDYIEAAADALEGLPGAILRGESPAYYDGHTGDFLLDCERIFRSVTKRLQRITPLQALGQD